jgi:hypothetical protein
MGYLVHRSALNDRTKVTVEFLTLLAVVQTLSCLLAVVVYLINDYRGRKEFVIFGALLIAAFSSDFLQFIFVFVLEQRANIVGNIYRLAEITLLMMWFRKLLTPRIHPGILNTVMVFLLLFALANLIFVQGYDAINSYTRTSEGVVMIVLSLLYFYGLLQDLPSRNIQRLPMFWINIGVLFYFSGIFFVMIFTDYMVNVLKADLVTPWIFHNFLGIVRYLLFAFALWQNRRNLRLV